LSAGKTSVECEYYKHRDATDTEMEDFLSFGKQVQKEVQQHRRPHCLRQDFDLCEQLQPNLRIGVYTSGHLHPFREEGVSFYQDIVRGDIFKHFEMEQQAQHPIYPARAAIIGDEQDDVVCKEQAICAAVEEGGKLSW